MTQENLKDEISLKQLILKIKEWFSYLLSKWKIILLFTTIGSIFGYFYSQNKEAIYVAELTFIVENDKPMVLPGSLAPTLGFDIGGSSNEGIFSNTNMIELFKTRRMVEKTLLTTINWGNKNISLADMYIYLNQSENKILDSKNIIFPIDKDRHDYSRKQDSILGTIFKDITKNHLNINLLDNKTSIIKVEMKYKNELFAKYFLEALAKVVSDDYYEIKTKKSKINMLFLQRQTDSVRVELYNAINGKEVEKNDNLNQEININRSSYKKQQVDIDINTKVLTEFIKQLEISKVAVRKDTPLIQIIDRPILPLPKEYLGKTNGILLGAFLAGFLIVFGLIVKRIIKELSL
jgi:uncharacterized protein involved in exopolysaccharide biosynthesis